MAATAAASGTAAREAWRLFWRVFMADKRRRWAILSELGISPQQSMALGTLKPGEPMPMSALADALHCDNSNITGIVDRLEAAGLAERRPSERDRRVKAVVLTGTASDADPDRAPRGEPPPTIAALSPRTRSRCATSSRAPWAMTEHPVGRIAQAAITFRLSFDMDRRARVLRTPRRREVSRRRLARARGSPSGVGSRQVPTGGGAVLVRANAVNAHPRRLAAAFAIVVALALPAAPAHAHDGGHHSSARVDHIVVVYQENHSFDNLYGRWEGVRGVRSADRAHTRQINQQGTPYTCLLQNDVNLTSPPLSARCTDTTTRRRSPATSSTRRS